MYQVGDYVAYHAAGVCKIIDRCYKDFGDGIESEYFVLETVYGNVMTIYISTDNFEDVLRPLLTQEEVFALIDSLPQTDEEWIADNATRKEFFQYAIQSRDQSELIRMVKLLYSRKQALEIEGKRLPFSDAEAMKEAEKLVTHEFAFVLGIEPDQAVPYIIERLSIEPLHSGDDAPGDDAPGKNVAGEDTPGDDAPGKDAAGEGTPGDDASGKGAAGEDAPGDDASGKDAAVEDTPAQ